ncbi:MAG: hypothetical protein J6W61_05065, partial [Bacteroidales bacterium]|nr:hypothetical protein [Bacteroidales bacterium]
SIEKGKENVLVFHDVRRYQFVNGILNKDDLFYEKLETLMHKYGENPLSAEIAATYANNLVESYSDSDSTTYDNYAKALEIAKTYISKFPKSEGAKQCQSVVDFIVDDDVSIQIQKTQLPNQPIAAVLKYRNTQHPYYRIVKVSEAELLEFNNLNRRDLIDKLLKKSAVAEKELDIPAEKDYRRHASVIDLPKLSVGQYYLVVQTSKNATDKSNKMATVRFQVSNLNYVYDEEERAITLYVMNRKTGAPIANVDVELFTRKYDYQARKYVNTKIASYKSNSYGKVLLEQQKQNESFHINLRYGNDMLLSERYMHVPEPYNDGQSYSISLFTDRAIYRPGQTVYFKGVVVQRSHDDIQLAEGIKDKLEFFISGNQQEIGEFVTDEYGSYSGSFVIPTDLLNGQFYLRSNYGGTHIRVEEYKRPTFEISFEKPKEQYKLKQDVTIHGSVDAYAGFALDDVKYTYRVIRRTNFPWRLWWWSYPVVEDEQIEYGEAKTDENGKFSITFNLKPSLDVMPDHQPLFVYDVEVTATSAQGETHSKTYSIRAGYNEICISTNISNLIEMNKMSTCQFEVMNMSGEPAKSKVSRKFYRYSDNGKVDFFDANGTTYRLSSNMLDRQLLTDEELASKFPEFDFYKENNRQKNRTLVYEDVVDVTEKANLFPANVTFQPGSYYVELKSLDDPLAVNGTEFTLFDSGSKKMPYTSMIWTDVDKKSAQPGETITFSLGSSMNNVKMWVRLMSEKDIRIEKWIDVDNGIVKLPYVVKEEDRGDLMLKVVFVKEGFVQSKNIIVSVPYDNLKLNVELATVRDVLTPGAEERWEVTVRDNEKSPVVSALLAGMYDTSLDVFASNSWYFNLMPWKYGSGNFYYDDGFGINNSSTNVSYIRYFVLFNYSLPSDAPFPVFVGYYGGKSRMIAYSRASNKSVMFDSADEMVVEMAVEESMAVQSAGAAMMVDEEVEEFKESAENGMEENSSSNAEEAMPTIRENFNETAFFYPDLRTNSDGSATFSFVMPDALTRWKLMMLAYTKDNKSGYNTYEFKSSKPVMIMADMPRYMYDNDTLWFVANVINTGDETVVPKAKLEIFDAVTMAPIDIVLSDPVVLMEELVPGRSKEVRWKVAAKHDLGLVAFRFTAYAGEFSDAEQHLLPVLSSEVFMTQTIPITVQADSKKSFDIKKASKSGSNERDYSMTLNFSTNPTWYAVQSLPYLANVSDKRAESAFYVFYANTLSAYIANKIPNLLNYIKKWQIETPDALMSQLEKDQDLKAIMLQETPWVMDAKNETEQR